MRPAIVLGASFSYSATGPVQLQPMLGDATNGCVSITGTEVGRALVTVTAAGHTASFWFDVVD